MEKICKICSDKGFLIQEYKGVTIRLACECRAGQVFAAVRIQRMTTRAHKLVETSLNATNTTEERYEAAKKLTKLSEEILGIVREEYQRGEK